MAMASPATSLDAPSAFSARLRPSSRTSSRSPNPPLAALDPAKIYHDLSPIATLKAIIANSELSSETPVDQNKLVQSIEAASTTEKSFAKKVAETSRLLRLWCDELDSWQWDGDFEVPQSEQEDGQVRDGDGEHSEQIDGVIEAQSIANGGYWGALPIDKVLKYETRLESIRDDLDELDVEGQKNHLLESHSRDRSSFSSGSKRDALSPAYAHLDDLTALVTSTIMQVLPYYSDLASLMNSWSARIAVLRQVPSFLAELEEAQNALDAAWLSIGVRQDRFSGLRRARTVKVGGRGMFRESFDKIRNSLEDKVAKLGQRIDAMLDMVEGQEETLPDKWIDTVEGFEIDYSSWTVEAQKKVLQYEFRLDLVQNRARGVGTARVSSSISPSVTKTTGKMPGAWSDQESGSASENEEDRKESEVHQGTPSSIAFVSRSSQLLTLTSASLVANNFDGHYLSLSTVETKCQRGPFRKADRKWL